MGNTDISKEEVQLMLDNHSKAIELSNVKAELERVQEENKDLIEKLATKPVEEIQEEVQEAVQEGQEINDGEKTALGKALEMVTGLTEVVEDLTVQMEEISSKFKELQRASKIKAVTPLASGIGKMTLSEDEEIEDEVEVKEEAKETEVLATGDEIESAIDVLEAYVNAVGTLPEAVQANPEFQEASRKFKKLASRRIGRKSSVASKRIGRKSSLASRRNLISKRKAVLASRMKGKTVTTSSEVETLKQEVANLKKELASVKQTKTINRKDLFKKARATRLASIRQRVKDNSRPQVNASKAKVLNLLKQRYIKNVETSSVQNTSNGEFEAGELANKMFNRKK